jgi:CHAD domain-containing protein
MGRKKWQIDDLNGKLSYCKAAGIVLKNRLEQVRKDISGYFTLESVEGLHRIRISLRRLRYSMELFISCYDKKKFMILYKKVTDLQDLSGKVRDFDVMKENMAVLNKEENVRISGNVLKKVDDMRNDFHTKLELDLMKFIHSKAVKNFEDLL